MPQPVTIVAAIVFVLFVTTMVIIYGSRRLDVCILRGPATLNATSTATAANAPRASSGDKRMSNDEIKLLNIAKEAQAST